MPRAREDDLCGLYCPKLLAIAVNYQCQKLFAGLRWEKLCHDVRREMENSSHACTRDACTVHHTSPLVPELGCQQNTAFAREVKPAYRCVSACSEWRGSRQAFRGDITAGPQFLTKPGIWHDSKNAAASFSNCFWSCTSSLLDSGKRTPRKGKIEKHKPHQLKETSHIQKAYSKSRWKVKVTLSSWN